MSQSGPRGPAQKPPAPPIAKPGSPAAQKPKPVNYAAPKLSPNGATPARAAPLTAPIAPTRPKVQSAPAIDEGWEDAEPTRIEDAPTQAREDTRAIVRTAVAEAIAPMLRAIGEIERRIDDLEKRTQRQVTLAAAPAPPSSQEAATAAPVVVPPAAPAPIFLPAATSPFLPAATPPAPAVAPSPPQPRVAPVATTPTAPIVVAKVLEPPVASAPAAMARSVAPAPVAQPLEPTLEQKLAAMAAQPKLQDFDVPFDGAKRKRRVIGVFLVLLLALFGGLAAMLAQHHMQ